MNKNIILIIGYYLKYLMLLLIIYFFLTFEMLNQFSLVYIPIAYLIIKFLFIHDIEKQKIKRKEIIVPIMIGFTIINFIFFIFLKLSLIYLVAVIFFVLFLKDKKSYQDAIIEENLKEFYQKKNNKN